MQTLFEFMSWVVYLSFSFWPNSELRTDVSPSSSSPAPGGTCKQTPHSKHTKSRTVQQHYLRADFVCFCGLVYSIRPVRSVTCVHNRIMCIFYIIHECVLRARARIALIKTRTITAALPLSPPRDNRSSSSLSVRLRRLSVEHTRCFPIDGAPSTTTIEPHTIYTKLISNNYMFVAEILNTHKYQVGYNCSARFSGTAASGFLWTCISVFIRWVYVCLYMQEEYGMRLLRSCTLEVWVRHIMCTWHTAQTCNHRKHVLPIISE